MMGGIRETLLNIIKNVKEGNDLKYVLLEYYKALDEKKRESNSHLDDIILKFRGEMLQLIQCEFGEVHTHLGSMGRQVYDAVIRSNLGEENQKRSMVPINRTHN